MASQMGLFGAEPTVDGDRDCWATPVKLFDELNSIFNFKIDVCALPWSAKCDMFYSPTEDGLSRHWAEDVSGCCGGGAAWCNPPFSGIAPWLEKAITESRRGLTVVCILPGHRREQPWWQRLVVGCKTCGAGPMVHLADTRHKYEPIADVRDIPGRVNYVPPPGIQSSGAEFPSCLAIYWGAGQVRR